MARYYGRIEADPELAVAYVKLAQEIEAWLKRGRPDMAAKVTAVRDQLLRDFRKLSEQSARESEKLIRARVNATQTRPVSGPRRSLQIAPGVHSDALTNKVGFPGGEVGIGNLATLDAAAVNAKYAGAGEYWRAQEYGTHKHVGRAVRGFFTDARGGGGNRSRPDGAQFRNHPYFENVTKGSDGTYPKGTPRMLITRPIHARYFMRDGFKESVAFHVARSTAIMNVAISNLP